MACAYRIDDDDVQQSKKVSQNEEVGSLLEKTSSELKPQSGREGVGEYETEISSIPTLDALSKVLLKFMPSEVVEMILRPPEEEEPLQVEEDGKSRSWKSDKGSDVEEMVSDSEDSSDDDRGRRRGRGSTAGGIAAAVTKSVRYAGDFLFHSAKQVTTGTADLLNTIAPQPTVSNKSDLSKSRDEKSISTSPKQDPKIRSFKEVKDMKKRYDREIKLLVAADIKRYVSIVLADVANTSSLKSGDKDDEINLKTACDTTAATSTSTSEISTDNSNCSVS